jgi:hypothetical protein
MLLNLVELLNLTFEHELGRNRDSNVKFAPPGEPEDERDRPAFSKVVATDAWSLSQPPSGKDIIFNGSKGRSLAHP